MGYNIQIAVCVFLLGVAGVNADTMETWKLLAIIVPSVVGGLTILSCLFYCCCWGRGGAATHMGGCGGCQNDCPGGCCYGCGNECRGGCCHGCANECQGGCCHGCGNECQGGCCYGCEDACCGCCNGRPRHPVTQTVYSSYQGPVQIQPVQKYSSEPTYVSNLPTAGAGVYGSGPYGFSAGGGPSAGVYSGSPSGPVYSGGRSGW